MKRLSPLRQHPILGLEIMPGMGDELRVARMIDGFDAGDDLHQSRRVLVDVLDQRVFGIAGPGNQNRAAVGDRSDDGLQEVAILRGVPAAQRVRLMVNVPRRMIRVQHQPFDVGRTEVEYAGFMVIDPNDRMKVMDRHGI